MVTQRKDFVFTSESVGEGHPDKVCDQISDAVLDEALRQDPTSHVACESSRPRVSCWWAERSPRRGYIDLPMVVRGVLKSIGYTDPSYGIDYRILLRHLHHPETVPRHRPGSERHGPPPRDGSGGPGHDVRLRVQRDPQPHAGAHQPCPPDHADSGQGAEGRRRWRSCGPTASARSPWST